MPHCVRLVLFALGVILTFAPAWCSAGTLFVELKQEAAIPSDVVHLEDVAALRGAYSNQLQRLAQVELGPSPEFGRTSFLSRQQIRSAILAVELSVADLVIAGAEAVQIVRQGRAPDSSAIAAALKMHILETTSWKESEIEIRAIGNLNGIEIPPDDVELRLAPGAAFAGRKSILAPIEIVQRDKTLRSFWITAEISVRASILTASRRIPFNKVIAAEDVLEHITEIPDLRASYARHPGELIGKVSRRSFSSGTPLTRDAFSEPFLVRHGETVELRLERNGIVLTSLAKAEQDGRLGQVITVRSLAFSSTPVQAQVTGRGTVSME